MAAAPCATPLMEKSSSQPAQTQQSSIAPERRPQTPPADTQKVAFKLGGSEETDLDSIDAETKDLDIANGNALNAPLS